MSWKTVRLGDILDYEQPTNYIVKSDFYNDNFTTPVLTAGKSFLLGYTNEVSGVFKNLPVIIFDDFTTASKYVDFPFKVKSSAMKILKAKEGLADTRFMFYLLQTLNLDSEQHKRYWISKFAPLEIPLPPLATQKRIAEILDAADALRRKDQELLKKYDELAQAIFIDMFGDPVKNEMGWDVKTIDEVATKVTDGDHLTPIRSKSGYKLLSCRNVKNGYIDFEAGLDFVEEDEFKRMFRRCNPEKGDILVSCSGTIGRVTQIKIDEKFVLVRSAALIKPDYNFIVPTYLEYFLQTDFMQREMHKSSNTSSQANLFTGPIKALPILIPLKNLQEKFAAKIQILENAKNMASTNDSSASNLFNSLIQKAFKGELIKS